MGPKRGGEEEGERRLENSMPEEAGQSLDLPLSSEPQCLHIVFGNFQSPLKSLSICLSMYTSPSVCVWSAEHAGASP